MSEALTPSTASLPDEPADTSANDLFATLALTQAALYVGTGIWPLISMRTFVKVTGPKMDHWLVKTVGVLVTVIGGTVGAAGLRRRFSPEVAGLAVGSAAALTAVDLVYVLKKRILPIYLLDALAELGLIACWAIVLKQQYGKRG